MFIRLFVVILLSAFCALGQNKPLYENPSAPLEKRVDDLVSRMTLDEKASQMLSDSPAIDRLGVPAYNWWNECLHGVARAGVATVFPQTVGMAASFDAPLLFRVATVISDEARAKHHEFVRQGKRGIYEGLTFWTPNINLFRDPRWGRGMETYGEDPFLTGQMAVQFVRGLQGDNPKYLKTIATAKHYAVHSGPESERHTFDVHVSERDLRQTYLPQFEMAIREGGARSVMCAYNSVDGKPACANDRLLDTILRNEWGFTGYVVSDCGAIGDIYLHHKSQPTAEAGVAAAVKAGTDLDCGVEYQHLVPAVKQGLLSEAAIDQAVKRLFTARFQLGMFDPPEMVPYAKIPYSVNDSPRHHELALEMARESVVLLKNDGTLPLKKNLRTIAVIGPNADSVEVLLGNYNGEPSAPVTPLEGIRHKVRRTRVLYAQGSDLAAGLPVFQPVPSSALFTSEGADAKNGLKAEYFNTSNFNGQAYRMRELTYPNSGKFSGTVPDSPKPAFTRVDPEVDFHWGNGAPRKDLDDDNFGVRWTGYLKAPTSGKYWIGANGKNALELYFDGKKIGSANNIHERSYVYEPVQLEAGKMYPVRLEFHETINDATIQFLWSPPRPNYEDEAVNIAKQAEAVVMVLGLSPRLEGEEMKVEVEGFAGGDRIQLGLPQVQEDLLKRISELNKPMVLVLLNGSAVAVNWAREHVPAIVELWYPGQAGGTALADVLFGDYNPAGRLPVTFYKSENQIPPFDQYDMKDKTYRFFTGEPLFPFGYGLSYTRFGYGGLQIPDSVKAGEDLKVSVEVENRGGREGQEVVQLYLKHVDAPVPVPIRSLEGFQRISLKAGERKRVEFALTARQLSMIGTDDKRAVEPGALEISVGGKQPGFTGAADASTTEVATGKSMITGERKVLE